MVTVEIQLRSAREALRRMHVLGCDSELHAGALRAINNAIDAIDKAKKEAKEHENYDGNGENV